MCVHLNIRSRSISKNTFTGESPDEMAYFGITPLMAAVFESRPSAAQILLKGKWLVIMSNKQV